MRGGRWIAVQRGLRDVERVADTGMSGICRTCKQPFVNQVPVAVSTRNAKSHVTIRICPDCSENMGKVSETEWSAAQYMAHRGQARRLLDGYAAMAGTGRLATE